jgi:glutathione synthase
VRIGIVITRASSVDATWTTLALARAALERGHSVRIVERADFQVEPTGRVVARAWAFEPPAPSPESLVDALRHRTGRRCFVDLARFDLLMLRSAPLSPDLLTFAQIARDLGVSVVNDPDGLVRVASKTWLAALPEVPTPSTLVTRSSGAASVFYRQQPHGVVVKPARGSGGRAVSHVPPHRVRQLERAFQTAGKGSGFVVLQAYLPAADAGEKRLLWLDGAILGGYLRRRAPGEFRHNLKRGGLAEPTQVTDRDRALAASLSPHLLGAGIRFAGLDLIGDHLIEVNALNPGGTFHTDRLSGTSHAHTVIAHLEQRAPAPRLTEDDPWALRAP